MSKKLGSMNTLTTYLFLYDYYRTLISDMDINTFEENVKSIVVNKSEPYLSLTESADYYWSEINLKRLVSLKFIISK